MFFVFRLNVFISKASNLLLSLGTEETRGFEPYPTRQISNKCIYDVFLMIYLSILLLLFFHFLTLLKGVDWGFTEAVIM